MHRFIRPLLIITCLLLLVSTYAEHLGADNPTGRRYASEHTLRTGNTFTIGDNAEQVLAKDLRLRNNNDVGACICRVASAYISDANCNACFIVVESLLSNTRRPDFVSARYIADSKNQARVSDLEQIRDFATAAAALNVPLYIYTRVDSIVSSSIHETVTRTGGRVVPYFTYPGYMDSIDVMMWVVRGIGSVILILIAIWVIRGNSPPRRVITPPPPPKTPPPPKPEVQGDSIEDGVSELKRRARKRVDEENARDDIR